MTHQGPPTPQRGDASTPGGVRQRWPGEAGKSTDDTDGDLPPWAGLGVAPRWAGEARQPGSRRQVAVARAKRARRTRYLMAGGAVAVIAVLAGVLVPRLLAPPSRAPSLGNLVTTFLPGESRTVPDSCAAVSAATLSRYLPGSRRTVRPNSLDGKAQSMCDWSLDAPPVYRLLNVTVQAYAPSGLASGDGSATNAAIDAYQQAMQRKTHPPKGSGQPPATVEPLVKTGSAGFSAVQVITGGGDRTDLITTVVRQRNVLITVVFDGLDHSPGGKYGPASIPLLRAGAAAAARDLLAALH